MNLLYQMVQIFYWLDLSIWLGSMVFLAVAAPVVFQVARRLEAKSERYSDPALADEQTTIVGGGIVGALLARLGQVQMICATALLPLMLLQFLMIDLAGTNLAAAGVRFALWLVAVMVLLYEWRSHYPRTLALRQKYLENAGDPDVANPARDAFDREHRRSEQLFLVTVCVLIGLVMLSANISPRGKVLTPTAPSSVE